MIQFLNTHKLKSEIENLIENAERELIICSPYLKLSDRIFEKLKQANERRVETVFIFREGKISENDLKQLQSLDNLNLFEHPNLHAKCFLNENSLIIGSMNLYAYSFHNNREMGVLFSKKEDWQNEVQNVLQDAKLEIRNIISGCTIIKKSQETIDDKFEIDIIKTPMELAHEKAREVNRIFVTKFFKPVETDYTIQLTCENYYDRVNVILNHRIEFNLDFEEEKLKDIYNKFKSKIYKRRYEGYKFYWNKPQENIYIYDDRHHNLWRDNPSEEISVSNRKKVIEQFIQDIKENLVIR